MSEKIYTIEPFSLLLMLLFLICKVKQSKNWNKQRLCSVAAVSNMHYYKCQWFYINLCWRLEQNQCCSQFSHISDPSFLTAVASKSGFTAWNEKSLLNIQHRIIFFLFLLLTASQIFYLTSVSVFLVRLWRKLKSSMETSAPTATEKKECKGSDLDGSSFTELPKKPSPTTLNRGTAIFQCCFLTYHWH